jgi:hypothetical protein
MININPRAGLMRGVRLWPDPEKILYNPFEENGQTLGYVLVYGEEAPAVFDGTTWHPLIENADQWSEMLPLISEQYYKIVEYAEKYDSYKQLAGFVTGASYGA